jgi:hypothetical protein
MSTVNGGLTAEETLLIFSPSDIPSIVGVESVKNMGLVQDAGFLISGKMVTSTIMGYCVLKLMVQCTQFRFLI